VLTPVLSLRRVAPPIKPCATRSFKHGNAVSQTVVGRCPPGPDCSRALDGVFARYGVRNRAALMYKVTIQATPVEKIDWKVMASGRWTPGEQPELGEEGLPAEVLAELFNVILSPADPSGRNQIQFGDTFYAVVFLGGCQGRSDRGGEPEQDSGMKVNTDSAMKPNSFRPIPEPRSA
jgi:hypothetical protein